MSQPEIPDWEWLDNLPEEEQQRIAQLIKGQDSYRNASPLPKADRDSEDSNS